ncbi:MAG: YSC84-related protein [Sphingomonadales bacterium]
MPDPIAVLKESPMTISMTLKRLGGFMMIAVIAVAFAAPAEAAKKKKIDKGVVKTMVKFHELVGNADALLARAAGVLVFPNIKKGGIGIGGEGGNGALLIKGKTVAYYNTASITIGFQLGFQVRRQVLVFLQKDALNAFRNSENWEVGVDGSVTLVTLDAGGEVSSETFNDPVIAFIFGGRGLMYNLTLEGNKITEIHPK